jgi:hypothetical protein
MNMDFMFGPVHTVGNFGYFMKTFERKVQTKLEILNKISTKMTKICTRFKNQESIEYILE